MEKQGKIDLIEKLVHVNRVSKTVKGGRNISFTVLAVVGDGHGRCNIAKGKANEAQKAARKAVESAKKCMVKIPLYEGRTLHHDVKARFGRGQVILRSAPPGTGIIAGGVMRSLLESLGVQDVVCKSMTSNNPHNVLRATMKALLSCKVPRAVASKRRVKLSNILSRRKMISESDMFVHNAINDNKKQNDNTSRSNNKITQTANVDMQARHTNHANFTCTKSQPAQNSNDSQGLSSHVSDSKSLSGNDIQKNRLQEQANEKLASTKTIDQISNQSKNNNRSNDKTSQRDRSSE